MIGDVVTKAALGINEAIAIVTLISGLLLAGWSARNAARSPSSSTATAGPSCPTHGVMVEVEKRLFEIERTSLRTYDKVKAIEDRQEDIYDRVHGRRPRSG